MSPTFLRFITILPPACKISKMLPVASRISYLSSLASKITLFYLNYNLKIVEK